MCANWANSVKCHRVSTWATHWQGRKSMGGKQSGAPTRQSIELDKLGLRLLHFSDCLLTRHIRTPKSREGEREQDSCNKKKANQGEATRQDTSRKAKQGREEMTPSKWWG